MCDFIEELIQILKAIIFAGIKLVYFILEDTLELSWELVHVKFIVFFHEFGKFFFFVGQLSLFVTKSLVLVLFVGHLNFNFYNWIMILDLTKFANKIKKLIY